MVLRRGEVQRAVPSLALGASSRAGNPGDSHGRQPQSMGLLYCIVDSHENSTHSMYGFPSECAHDAAIGMHSTWAASPWPNLPQVRGG